MTGKKMEKKHFFHSVRSVLVLSAIIKCCDDGAMEFLICAIETNPIEYIRTYNGWPRPKQLLITKIISSFALFSVGLRYVCEH